MPYPLTNPKTLQTIDSPFLSDMDAGVALLRKIEADPTRGTPFARDILRNSQRGAISQAQRFWLHKMALPDNVRPAARTEQGLDFTRVRQMFDQARNHLRKPAILLRVPATGRDIRLHTAGPQSRYPGEVMVVAPSFGQGYYGRVNLSGVYTLGPDACPEVTDFLRELSLDPERIAGEYGRLTGKCCFCNHGLKDERGTEVGYGPVCAKNFGMAWGSK